MPTDEYDAAYEGSVVESGTDVAEKALQEDQTLTSSDATGPSNTGTFNTERYNIIQSVPTEKVATIGDMPEDDHNTTPGNNVVGGVSPCVHSVLRGTNVYVNSWPPRTFKRRPNADECRLEQVGESRESAESRTSPTTTKTKMSSLDSAEISGPHEQVEESRESAESLTGPATTTTKTSSLDSTEISGPHEQVEESRESAESLASPITTKTKTSSLDSAEFPGPQFVSGIQDIATDTTDTDSVNSQPFGTPTNRSRSVSHSPASSSSPLAFEPKFPHFNTSVSVHADSTPDYAQLAHALQADNVRLVNHSEALADKLQQETARAEKWHLTATEVEQELFLHSKANTPLEKEVVIQGIQISRLELELSHETAAVSSRDEKNTELQEQNTELQEHNTELQEHNTELQEQIAAQYAARTRMGEHRQADQDLQVTELKEDLAAERHASDTMAGQIVRHDIEMSRMANRDHEIAELKNQLAAQCAATKKLGEGKANQDRQMSDLQDDLAAERRASDTMAGQIVRHDIEMSRMANREQEIAELNKQLAAQCAATKKMGEDMSEVEAELTSERRASEKMAREIVRHEIEMSRMEQTVAALQAELANTMQLEQELRQHRSSNYNHPTAEAELHAALNFERRKTSNLEQRLAASANEIKTWQLKVEDCRKFFYEYRKTQPEFRALESDRKDQHRAWAAINERRAALLREIDEFERGRKNVGYLELKVKDLERRLQEATNPATSGLWTGADGRDPTKYGGRSHGWRF